jgi:hypothetical protein
LLEHIATGGGRRGPRWESSRTAIEMNAIMRLPKKAWTQAVEQDGTPIDDAFVAGLLDLPDWTEKIPGLRQDPLPQTRPRRPRELRTPANTTAIG